MKTAPAAPVKKPRGAGKAQLAPAPAPVGDHKPFRLDLSPRSGNGGNAGKDPSKPPRHANGVIVRPTSTPFIIPALQDYFGSKAGAGTYQRLINQIPPHETYCEPFIGGGAIMRTKLPAAQNFGYDLDAPVVDAWIDQGPKWAKVLHGDAFEYLPHMFHRGVFLFIDPPYLIETLRSKRDQYRHNFTYDQHVQLLQMLVNEAAPAMVMICALPNLLYEQHLAGWRTFQYTQQTRHGMQTEQVWMNYPEPTELHDYRYLGDNYRKRQDLQLLIKRNVQKLQAMPPLHRKALLNALNQVKP